ncbi:GNAT family N-acetyltransferase [Nakamurella endophytica]|uniref:GNAT family N-acetyltransferase n=1 Tax=Nakamurella endophytica TaxID=1748367 RepID=UPI0035715DB9
MVAAAFGGPPVADLVDALRDDTAWRELSFVAVTADKRVVGHLLFTTSVLSDGDGPAVELLQLSPLAVQPDVQRRGVGSALVRYGLAVTDARPEPAVIGATPATTDAGASSRPSRWECCGRATPSPPGRSRSGGAPEPRRSAAGWRMRRPSTPSPSRPGRARPHRRGGRRRARRQLPAGPSRSGPEGADQLQ